MPTLGAAQLVGYLKSKVIPCKLYDINIDLIQQVKITCGNFSPIYQKLLGDDGDSFKSIIMELNLLSAVCGDFLITHDNFSCNFNWRNIYAVKRFINGDSEIIRILRNMRIFEEISINSRFIGISVSYEDQIIFALAIAVIIKRKNPKVSIILGGSFFYNYENESCALFLEINALDYLIIGPGEAVLERLVEDGIQGVCELQGVKSREFSGRWLLDTRDLTNHPVVYNPDFSNLDFNMYPTKEKAFPYMIRSKCYYGKCNFCNGDKANDTEQFKNIDKAIESMAEISERIGIGNVYIVDAALSWKDFSKLSTMPLACAFRWIANARFDDSLLTEGLLSKMEEHGCVMLRFGLESGSQRVLDLMNKGVNIEVASAILKESAACGIKNHVYIMFGYPGETAKDRLSTIEFLQAHRRYIFSYSVSLFNPIPNTPIYMELKRNVSNEGNVHDNMISLIYRSEENYTQIMKDVEQVRIILEGYAQTNAEYYSANVFSPIEEADTPIVIRSYMVVDRCDEYYERLRLKSNLTVRQIDAADPLDSCVILDLYKNIKIHLFLEAWLINILKKEFSGSEPELFGTLNTKQRETARELLQLISTHSHCIGWKSAHSGASGRFSLEDKLACDCGGMSIQFTPTEVLVDKECEIWME